MLVSFFAVALRLAAIQDPDTPVAITDVTVIDVARGAPMAAQTVVIRGGRIVAVGASSRVSTPAGARVIDGRGKFLIPGLWDFHVHATGPVFEDLFQPLLVANGVTAVRDMWGQVPAARAARAKIARGELVGPRSVVAGNIVDGTPPIWPGSTGVGTPEDARRIVDSIAAAGGAFIKVYSRLDPEVFRAIAFRAKERGISFAGHIPTLVAAREASDLGQRTVEHLTNLLTDCSRDRDAIRTEVAAAVASPKRWDSAGVLQRGQASRVLASHDPGRCRELARRFKANGTVMVPTMTVLRSVAYLDDSTLRDDARLKYIPSWYSGRWDPRQDFRFRMLTADDWALRKRAHTRQLEIIRLFREEGVTFLPGTDLANPYLYPGFSLHDELANFVAIGYSPAEALRAATLGPAEFLRATDSLGTVATGKLADLVLLDANPLVDIRNTTRIATVVADGRVYDRAALDVLLAEAEKRATAPPGGAPPVRTTAADTIRRLDSLWARMYATHDTTTARALYSDDLVWTSVNGTRKDKSGELADVRPMAGLVMEYFRTGGVEVRVYEGAAVVTGLAEWKYTMNGTPSEVRRRYTMVYVRGGPMGWRVVAVHIGRAP